MVVMELMKIPRQQHSFSPHLARVKSMRAGSGPTLLAVWVSEDCYENKC